MAYPHSMRNDNSPPAESFKISQTNENNLKTFEQE